MGILENAEVVVRLAAPDEDYDETHMKGPTHGEVLYGGGGHNNSAVG